MRCDVSEIVGEAIGLLSRLLLSGEECRDGDGERPTESETVHILSDRSGVFSNPRSGDHDMGDSDGEWTFPSDFRKSLSGDEPSEDSRGVLLSSAYGMA